MTIYLSDRADARRTAGSGVEVLGEHAPALTIIIADIYAEEWLLGIEALAVA